MNKPLLSLAFSAAVLAGCQTTASDDPPRATAQLKSASGSKAIGEATFEQTGSNKVLRNVAGGIGGGPIDF